MVVRYNVKIVEAIELTTKSCIADKSKDVEVLFILSGQLFISFFIKIDLWLSFLALSLLRCWAFLNWGFLSLLFGGLIFQFLYDIVKIFFSVCEAILVAVDADESIKLLQLVVTRVLNWCTFVFSKEQYSGHVLHLCITSTACDDFFAVLGQGIHVAESNPAGTVAVPSCEWAPGSGKITTALAKGVDKRNSPDVILVV